MTAGIIPAVLLYTLSIHELPARPEKVKAGIDALAKGEPNPNVPEKYFLGSDFEETMEDIRNNPAIPEE